MIAAHCHCLFDHVAVLVAYNHRLLVRRARIAQSVATGPTHVTTRVPCSTAAACRINRDAAISASIIVVIPVTSLIVVGMVVALENHSIVMVDVVHCADPRIVRGVTRFTVKVPRRWRFRWCGCLLIVIKKLEPSMYIVCVYMEEWTT
jgi:hypothetical protein